MIRVSDTVVVEEHELEERFVRSSGPGGQNVNKLATAVELRFDLRHSTLSPDVKARVLAEAGSRVSTKGVLVIDSREHRTQGQNRIAARERLAELLRRAAIPPKARRRTAPRLAERQRRLDVKRRRSQTKALRGKAHDVDD